MSPLPIRASHRTFPMSARPTSVGKFNDEAAAKKFWDSDAGKKADAALMSLLSIKPVRLTELGIPDGFARQFGILPKTGNIPRKLVTFLRANPNVEVKTPLPGADWCGLRGKDENYWGQLPQGSLHDDGLASIVQTHDPRSTVLPPKIPIKYGWGVLSSEKAIFDGEQLVLNYTGTENQTLDVEINPAPFPYLRTLKDFALGDFITATHPAVKPIGAGSDRLCYDLNSSLTPFMVRTWTDFTESDSFDSIESYLAAQSGGLAVFSPKYSTHYPKLLIHDNGKLYAGFQYIRQENQFVLQTCRKSRYDFNGITSFKDHFRVINHPISRVKFGDDEFTLVAANRWLTQEAFFGDSAFWEITELQSQPLPEQSNGLTLDNESGAVLSPGIAADVRRFFTNFRELVTNFPGQTYLAARLIYNIQQMHSGDINLEKLLDELNKRLAAPSNVDVNDMWDILPESMFSQNYEAGQNQLREDIVAYGDANNWDETLTKTDVEKLWQPDGTGIQISDGKLDDNSHDDGNDDGNDEDGNSASQTTVGGTISKPQLFNCGEDEVQFLRSLLKNAEKCGFNYNARDIIRFHTSVKTGFFTLLGGFPGCGKSTLAALYSRALLGKKSIDADSGFLTIDVNPSWMEPDDILGHWNLDKKYSAASSRLVPFIQSANCNHERISIVCLEEMNLARVEHYFSNFLQLMSRPENERKLNGIPADETQTEKNAELLVPANLRIVGTNNFDETTQRFSARFYDRCNYIELDNRASGQFPALIPSFERGNFDNPVCYSQFKAWHNREDLIGRIDRDVVERFNLLVKELTPLGLSPSPRVCFAIMEYILNRPFFPGCGTECTNSRDCQMAALDEALSQRVLPRYSVNFLRDETSERESLLTAMEDMPLSHDFFERRCDVGERPLRQ